MQTAVWRFPQLNQTVAKCLKVLYSSLFTVLNKQKIEKFEAIVIFLKKTLPDAMIKRIKSALSCDI